MRALGSITTNKASGGDGIPVELFQILKDDAIKVLHSICQQIYPGEGYSYPLQCSGLEESGRLQSMGSQRVRHDGATSLSFFLSLSLE